MHLQLQSETKQPEGTLYHYRNEDCQLQFIQTHNGEINWVHIDTKGALKDFVLRARIDLEKIWPEPVEVTGCVKFSTKGGAGRSILAVSYAQEIAEEINGIFNSKK